MDIKEITLNDLLKSILEAQSVIEEMEGKAKVLKDEILDRLKASKITGTVIDDHYVARVRRTIFTDVTMSQAQELGAVKQSIDQDKLRALISKGIKIKGVKMIEFLSIREKK